MVFIDLCKHFFTLSACGAERESLGTGGGGGGKKKKNPVGLTCRSLPYHIIGLLLLRLYLYIHFFSYLVCNFLPFIQDMERSPGVL